MKTKHTLTILGGYNILFGLMAMFASTTMAGVFVNSKNLDVIRMGEIFHIGLGHAIFLVGLILMFPRNAELAAAKTSSLPTLLALPFFFISFSELWPTNH